ncbi:hypothetical protein SDC9_141064 [bioreactor metagenome]|uniref:Uncharacterized protein n=1 Tax=bioreactor metagenome TaxID=1076179 RepID=A0A645E015_9ZZZZ
MLLGLADDNAVLFVLLLADQADQHQDRRQRGRNRQNQVQQRPNRPACQRGLFIPHHLGLFIEACDAHGSVDHEPAFRHRRGDCRRPAVKRVAVERRVRRNRHGIPVAEVCVHRIRRAAVEVARAAGDDVGHAVSELFPLRVEVDLTRRHVERVARLTGYTRRCALFAPAEETVARAREHVARDHRDCVGEDPCAFHCAACRAVCVVVDRRSPRCPDRREHQVVIRHVETVCGTEVHLGSVDSRRLPVEEVIA